MGQSDLDVQKVKCSETELNMIKLGGGIEIVVINV
jgi:hypothetical protein